MKDAKINVRVDEDQLKRLQKALGLDQSKTIRACMNCTENVLRRFFGGEVSDIFRRDEKDESKAKYQNNP